MAHRYDNLIELHAESAAECFCDMDSELAFLLIPVGNPVHTVIQFRSRQDAQEAVDNMGSVLSACQIPVTGKSD